MINDLLQLADLIAKLDGAKPKQASLRRAVSTAYYGLSHAIAQMCAEMLIGWSRTWEFVTPIYRSVDHQRMRTVLNNVREKKRFGASGETIALAFIALQEARMKADYDPAPFRFTRSGTLELIDQAREAAEAITQLPREDRLMLAIQLIAKAR